VIVLDTNVVSELMRPTPDATVAGWLDRQPPESVWTTAVNLFELRYGIEILADDRRRERLQAALAKAVEEDLEGRILPFEQRAAREAAVIAAQRRQAGQPMEIRDLQIAAIVATRQATLATRNIRHFSNLRIGLVDPWAA
jgi:toxin FitB